MIPKNVKEYKRIQNWKPRRNGQILRIIKHSKTESWRDRKSELMNHEYRDWDSDPKAPKNTDPGPDCFTGEFFHPEKS